MAPIELGKVELSRMADAGWPHLKRGMVVTVHRPFSLGNPLWSLLAWRIRAHSGRLAGHEATEHHAMLYAGAGRCWSQDQEFDLVKLSDYAGCRLSFFDPPATIDERNQIMGACGPHKGRSYGYRDILGYLAWSITGSESLLGLISDKRHWHCSEAVCRLMRAVFPRVFGPESCEQKHPQALYDWMQDQGWPQITMWVK